MSRTTRKYQGKKYRDGQLPDNYWEYCNCSWCVAISKRKRKLKEKIMNREMKRELKEIDELL